MVLNDLIALNINHLSIDVGNEVIKDIINNDKLNNWYTVDGIRVFQVKNDMGKVIRHIAFLILS